MQLIWMSGPTGRVRSWRITLRQVLWGGATAVGVLFLISLLLNLAGWRLAVNVAPTVASVVGGVTSASEQERREARFREQLGTLESHLERLQGELVQMQQSRDKLVQQLGVAQLVGPEPAASRNWPFGRGGPLRVWPLINLAEPALDVRLEDFQRRALGLDEAVTATRGRWLADEQRLQALPVALPLEGTFRLTSGFGPRPDPFTGQSSLHEGVDLVADVGTPVLATAAGVVTRSEQSGDLGLWVEVDHGNGFATRYGHLQRRDVQAGQPVTRGQVLGALGNTGRSSGPHLHYEILHGGRAVPPKRALELMARQQPRPVATR